MRRTREAEQIFLLCKTDLTRTRAEFHVGRQRWRRNDIWSAVGEGREGGQIRSVTQRNVTNRPTVCSRLLLEPDGGRLSRISVSRRPGASVLVCLCHFRDTVPDLTRKIDSYLKSCEIDGYLVFPLCLLAPTERRHFFRPNCCIKTYPLPRTMNFRPRFDPFMDGNALLASHPNNFRPFLLWIFSFAEKEIFHSTRFTLIIKIIAKGGISETRRRSET